ncbi:MAG: hypothetical protein BWZ04_03100 [Firmicutes bacterium ADurb.BinA205]|nr:MAG: hypothetical protein BWZ04_03100 [Firmicutes bacterium ADurb.BinA205]
MCIQYGSRCCCIFLWSKQLLQLCIFVLPIIMEILKCIF